MFGVELKPHLVHEAVRAELNARRQGTRGAKTRGFVSGGRSKPWRQKGTGRARQGTIRAPQFTGGGVVFAPGPRDFDLKVNRKALKAALRSALSDHAQGGTLGLLTATTFDTPSASAAAKLLQALGKNTPTVVVAERRRGQPDQELPQPRPRDRRPPDRARGRRGRVGALAARQRGRAADPAGEGVMSLHPSEVLIRPVVSEKSYEQIVQNRYTFRVHQDAHKTQIRQAVEQLFDVSVVNVNIVMVKPKPKRRGATKGTRSGWKKAIVQLKRGDSIEIFEGAQL